MNTHVDPPSFPASDWRRSPELRVVFRNKPVLSGEDESKYDGLLEAVLEDVAPSDRVEAIWVKNAVDCLWEMMRIDRARRHVLSRARAEAARQLLRRRLKPDSEGARNFEAQLDKWSDGDDTAESQIVALLARQGLTLQDVANHAYAQEFDTLARFDKAAAQLQARHDKLLKSAEHRGKEFIERYRPAAGSSGFNTLSR